MIKIDDRKGVYQFRKGEPKTKRLGRLMHNPNVCGPAEKREPFVYINGACLTADDCTEIANWLRHMAGVHQFEEHHRRLAEEASK